MWWKRERHEACLNCGTKLTGPFCHVCGQRDDDYRRPFLMLGSEFLSENFVWDSRLMRSVLPFIFRPGRLTRSYIEGHRNSYVTPLRLYFVVSLLFFLILGFSNIAIMQLARYEVTGDPSVGVFFGPSADMEEGAAKVEKSGEPEQDSGYEIVFFQRLEDGAERPQVPEDVINDVEIDEESEAALKELGLDPRHFLKTINLALDNPLIFNEIFNDWLPWVLFFMVPFFAFLLSVVYVRRPFYYIDHLIFSIHYHAFAFFIFIFIILKRWLLPELISDDLIALFIFLAINIYLFGAMKHVYQQGWINTTFKFIFIWSIYSTTVLIAVISIAVGGLFRLAQQTGALTGAG